MVPQSLADRTQWLVWRYERRPGDAPTKKPRKVPYYANGTIRQGELGGVADRSQLTIFDHAQRSASIGKYDGVGFAFLGDDNLIGIDLDPVIVPETGEIIEHVIEPRTGNLSERAAGIVRDCASFTQYSPSGTGLHIYVHGKAKSTKSDDIGVELYCGGRFFTFTGKHYPGTPEEVAPIRPEVLAGILAMIEEAKEARRARTRPTAAAPKPAPTPSSGSNDFALVNEAAIGNLEAWVPTLFPGAQRAAGGFRVTSSALGRDLEEDLSIRNDGIVDWGVHDLGDPHEGRRTPIDLVIEWSTNKTPKDALHWLAGQLGITLQKPTPGRKKKPAAGGADQAPPPEELGHGSDDGPPDDGGPGGDDGGPQDEGRGLPIINWLAGELPECVDAAEAALLGADVGLYQRTGMVVRVVKRDTPSVRNYKREPGALGIVMVDAPHLVETFTRVAYWRRYDNRAAKFRRINAPEQVATTYLARSGHWKLPRLRATLSAPTLRPDGSLLQQPGYDVESQSWYDPCGIQFPTVPDKPTMDEARIALELLGDAFGTFPWDTPFDESVAISLVLTALVRRSLTAAPLGAITAPVMASGKTLLADCVAIMATGTPAPAMKYPDSDEEAVKTLLAVLAEGDPCVLIDNIERPLQGDALCSMLTSETYRGRVLGRTQMMDVPTTTLFMATGNQLVISGDLRTRALLCRLDPRVERPEQREFHTDLRQWMTAHRPELVAAGLTVMRAFITSGVRVEDVVKPWGRFEHWSAMVRAPLVWLGLPDPCESLKSLEDEDPERNEYLRLIHAWHACFDDKAHTAREAVEEASDVEVASDGRRAMWDILREIAVDRGGQFNIKRLAKWLGRHKGRRVGGWQLLAAGECDHVALFKVEKVK